MSRVVHFEIPATDPEELSKFYINTFGWKFNKWGDQNYWLIETGEKDEPGINGGMMTKKDSAQPIVNSIDVKNIDEAAEAVSKNGGEIVVPKMAIPTVGWMFYFKDPDGNIFGAYQHDPEAK